MSYLKNKKRSVSYKKKQQQQQVKIHKLELCIIKMGFFIFFFVFVSKGLPDNTQITLNIKPKNIKIKTNK